MCKVRLIFFLFVSFVLFSPAEHELRTWVDVDGNEFYGRFHKELFGKLTIESEDGKQRTFRLEELSELDQKYLRVNVPPQLKIDVSVKSRNIPPRPAALARPIVIHDYWLEVEIEKKSQRPFTSRLTVDIYLVGDEVSEGLYVLMDKTEKSFLLPEITKGSSVQLRSNRTRIERFQAGLLKGGYGGQEYGGYIVVVYSKDRDIVHIESSLPSWSKDPEIIRNLDTVYREGAASWVSRFFDEDTGKKIPPPRPPER